MRFYFAEKSSVSPQSTPLLLLLPTFLKQSHEINGIMLCPSQWGNKSTKTTSEGTGYPDILSSIFFMPLSHSLSFFLILHTLLRKSQPFINILRNPYITISLPKDKLKNIYRVMNKICTSKTKSTYSNNSIEEFLVKYL